MPTTADCLRWKITPIPAEVPDYRLNDRVFPRLVRLMLAQRGVLSPDEQEAFLLPKLAGLGDPFALPEMDLAVARILQAVDCGERTVIYGDYDVDGVTSITLLREVLAAYGLASEPFLPSRMGEGYGLSFEGVERCLASHQPSLVIAVDCGTGSLKEIAALKEKGIDTIVCDHHEAHPDGRPPCVALVNPKLGDDLHYLCTAGVVFKLAHALLKTRPCEGFDLRTTLDLLALATVADIVPLEGENRSLVRHGLKQLALSKRPGVKALAKVAGCSPPFSAMDIGFRMGPRLNAAGRLDTAEASLALLLCDDDEEAEVIAADLDYRNRERQNLELEIRRKAEAMIEETYDADTHAGIVVGGDGWHPGVVGIVSARLARRFHRPTFVVGFDEDGLGKGSGRSVPGVSLVECINRCRGLLEKGGGHAMAAGISLREDKLDDFREMFCRCVREIAGDGELEPVLEVDAEVLFEELDFTLFEACGLMEPFGSGNPEPVLFSANVRTSGDCRVLNERHYKLRLEQGGIVMDAIYFDGVNDCDGILPPQPWDVAFALHRNEFRGRVSLQLVVKSIRSHEPLD
ncbi:MAG: single-stranded-DNA-specific exonuclease RecJ [Verrucomicrobiota bacterium]